MLSTKENAVPDKLGSFCTMSSKSILEVPLFVMMITGDWVAVAVQVLELEVLDACVLVGVGVGVGFGWLPPSPGLLKIPRRELITRLANATIVPYD
jgi:hypothetical protein